MSKHRHLCISFFVPVSRKLLCYQSRQLSLWNFISHLQMNNTFAFTASSTQPSVSVTCHGAEGRQFSFKGETLLLSFLPEWEEPLHH